MPEWRCADKQCDHAIWTDKKAKAQ
jgi:hypothetical protein